MSGIEKEVDKLGKIVIPKQYRNKLGIMDNDKLTVSLVDTKIVLSPTQRRCILCEEKLLTESERICAACTARIKNTE